MTIMYKSEEDIVEARKKSMVFASASITLA